MYSITVRHHFDAAHRLQKYDGKCANLHGHRWEVEVSLWGGNLHNGMVVDFGLVKAAISTFDHTTILEENDPLYGVLRKYVDKKSVVPFPKAPTAENIAEHLCKTINNTLAMHELEAHVLYVTVWETPNNEAQYVESE